jgi:hypothetical protein
MSTYRVEWKCCGSVTETNCWKPDECPFCKADLDGDRWRHFASSPQTALMLGTSLDPNSEQNWRDECNKLADAGMAKTHNVK